MGRPVLLVLALFALAVCRSQTMSVTPSTISGVELIGPQSPEYGTEVDQIFGAIRSEYLNAWLPYGVALHNGTSQKIVALAVRWDATNTKGQTNRAGTIQMEAFSDPAHQMPPGKVGVALPSLTFFMEGSKLPRQSQLTPPPGYVPSGNGNLPHFQSAQSVKAMLDGVVFASGQFVGPNTTQAYEGYLADTTVPPQVASKVLEMKAAGVPIADVVAWLETTAANPHGGTKAANVTARAARSLLSQYKRKGESSLCQVAQSQSQPVIHLYR
jgi:hypothetical protein